MELTIEHYQWLYVFAIAGKILLAVLIVGWFLFERRGSRFNQLNKRRPMATMRRN